VLIKQLFLKIFVINTMDFTLYVAYTYIFVMFKQTFITYFVMNLPVLL